MKRLPFFVTSLFVFSLLPAVGYAATIALSPSSGTYSQGSTITVDVMLDTQGAQVDGFDIHYLHYNPAVISIQDEDAVTPGIQIKSNNIFPITQANTVDTNAGTISFDQISSGGSKVSTNGAQSVATFHATVIASGPINLTFDAAPGSTTDTNVAANGQDMLTSATNATYNAGSNPMPNNGFAMPAGLNEGDLVRGPDGIKVYIINQYGFKRHIFNPRVFSLYHHFKWNAIKSLDQATLDMFHSSDMYRVAGDTRIYSLKEVDEARGIAQKQWLSVTAQEFVNAGLSWNQIFIINQQEANLYQNGTALSAQDLAYPLRGHVVRIQGSDTVYYINNKGVKKPIASAQIFVSYGNRWDQVVVVSADELNKYADFQAIVLAGGDGKVYVLTNGQKHWVASTDVFSRLQLDWNRIVVVNQTEFNSYPEGDSVQ